MTNIISKTEKTIKIEVEIPIKSTMLKTEEEIQKSLNIAGCEASRIALSMFDTDGKPIMKGKSKYTSKGQLTKKYQTPYGEIELARHVYQSNHGGKTFCPLDNSARIIVGSTPKFSKQISSKYSELGSKRVQVDMQENHGRYISRAYIQDISEAVATGLIAKQDNWHYTLPVEKEHVKSIGISLEGTCMLLSQQGYREAMVGAIALYDKEGNRLYTQYTASAPEYGKKIFFGKFENEISEITKKYPNSEIIGIADGAKENWIFLGKYTQLQILDFYHASEYISLASECIFRFNDDKEEWVGKMCHELKHETGGAEAILLEMSGYSKTKMSEKKKKDLKRCITYFNNHKNQMNYPAYHKSNYPIGSGVIEAACKVIIKQRLCNSGMKWKREGAENVLKLRCLNYSETQWSQSWKFIDKYGI